MLLDNENNMYLFSRTKTCPPCRVLESYLNRTYPDWKNTIIHIDLNNDSEEAYSLAIKFGVNQLPSFVSKEEVVFTGFKPNKIDEYLQRG